MTFDYCRIGTLALLTLGISFTTKAQMAPPTTVPTPTSGQASYTAAHDTLMRRVATVHAQAEARLAYFNSSQGSLSGLHRRVRAYAAIPNPVVSNYGSQGIKTGLVKKQTIRRCFGVELERVVYYDARNRTVLKERYEAHRLTRLELFEYQQKSSSLTASWLFVRGDYLRHSTAFNPLAHHKNQRKSYFFNPRPAGE